MKTALLVYAHPGPKSFTADLRDRTEPALTELGYDVVASDLHAQNFPPLLDRHDFMLAADADDPRVASSGRD